MDSKSASIRVGFPLSQLDGTGGLLQPSNLANVAKYYLLENLAAGLVRDSISAPSGYEGVLASRWKQESSSRWTFFIRGGSKWSDGSPITLEEIAEHFRQLAKTPSRHLFYLRNLSRVETDNESGKLTFTFSSDTSDGLLHELSLADAFLVRPEPAKHQWAVTSGPYFISKIDLKAKEPLVRLEKNSHFPAAAFRTADRVDLVDLPQDALTQQLKAGAIDIYSLPYPGFSRSNRELARLAPSLLVGQPIRVYLFRFNPLHPETGDPAVRRWFASAIRNGFGTVAGDRFYFDGQFLPMGYPGRLPALPQIPGPLRPPRKGKLSVHVRAGVEELNPPWLALERTVHEAGSTLSLIPGPTPTKASADWFAELFCFRGNQKEPLGSWNFLFSEENGEASQFRPQVLPLMDAIAVERSSSEALSEKVALLHRRVLSEALIVPVLVESPTVAHSKQVDLSRWNLFDLRLRFYDVEMRR